jgi:hypothetical protein
MQLFTTKQWICQEKKCWHYVNVTNSSAESDKEEAEYINYYLMFEYLLF